MSKITKSKNRQDFRSCLRKINNMEISVKEITPYQFRLDDAIDIYPTGKKAFDLIRKKWLDIGQQDFIDFITNFFAET